MLTLWDLMTGFSTLRGPLGPSSSSRTGAASMVSSIGALIKSVSTGLGFDGENKPAAALSIIGGCWQESLSMCKICIIWE